MRRLISKTCFALRAIAALLVFAGGCRHADVNRELVERELRLQEDELYRLHDEVASREKLLESTRQENATLKRELQQARAGAPLPADTMPAMPPAPDDAPSPGRARPPDSGVPPTDVVPPVIEIPGRSGIQPPSGAAAGRPSWTASRGVQRASFEASVDEPGAPDRQTPQESTDNRIAKIVLNRRLTGGYNADNRLGDEGLTVVIEPRNADDRIVESTGDCSVVVIDPALSGDAARIARWDFPADQIARLRKKSPHGEGLHLTLRWPDQPPEHERLVVFARYAIGAERHEDSQSILIDLARDPSNAAGGVD